MPAMLAKHWFTHRTIVEPEIECAFVCVCVLQKKQSEMDRLKEQLLEVEKQRDEHNNTIGKLRQVKISLLVSFLDGATLMVYLQSGEKWLFFFVAT